MAKPPVFANRRLAAGNCWGQSYNWPQRAYPETLFSFEFPFSLGGMRSLATYSYTFSHTSPAQFLLLPSGFVASRADSQTHLNRLVLQTHPPAQRRGFF